MTYFYETYSVSSKKTELTEEEKEFADNIIRKKNWRIVQLPSGWYQSEYLYKNEWKDVTRRATIEACEKAIDDSIEYYKKKLEPKKEPIVVKSFKE